MSHGKSLVGTIFGMRLWPERMKASQDPILCFWKRKLRISDTEAAQFSLIIVVKNVLLEMYKHLMYV